MTNAFKNIAPALARSWVRLYTSGMPRDLSEERRAEIDADLWEQQQDAEIRSRSLLSVAVEILLLRNRMPSVGILFGSEMSSIMVGRGVAGIGYALWSRTRPAPALDTNL
jgi:hypothetical protein